MGYKDVDELVVAVERRFRGLVAELISNMRADEMTAPLTRVLLPLKDSRHTITFDNCK